MLSIKALSVQHVSHSHKGKYNLKIWNDIYASQVHDIYPKSFCFSHCKILHIANEFSRDTQNPKRKTSYKNSGLKTKTYCWKDTPNMVLVSDI